VVILDTFFRSTGIPADPDELPYLRSIYDALNGSQIVITFRDTIIPAFMAVFSFMVPTPISDMY
jgi:hypothetical protein